MPKNKSNVNKILEELFIQAQQKGGTQYIYTLLRVTGITKQLDPLLKIKAIIKELNYPSISDSDFLDKYKAIMEINDPLDLIANLINCINKEGYNINPFLSLNNLYTFAIGIIYNGPKKKGIKNPYNILYSIDLFV